MHFGFSSLAWCRCMQGFEKTGLGERIANLFVRALGSSTLGLAYGLNVAEALLAPAMPSTSARAGKWRGEGASVARASILREDGGQVEGHIRPGIEGPA